MRKIILACSGAICVLFGSCSNVVYVPFLPDKVNAPGIGEKGELKADVSVSTGYKVSADAAYAPINHLVLTGSYRRQHMEGHGETRINGQVTSKHASIQYGNRGDIGLGYFTAFGKRGRFETIGGFGIGKIYGSGSEQDFAGVSIESYKFNMQMQRYFLQAGVGTDGKVFSMMGGIRLTYQQYKNLYGESSPNTLIIFGDGPLHIQPYIDLRIGYKYFKFTTQVGFSYSTVALITGVPQSSTPVSGGFPWPYASAGIALNIAPRFSLRKNQ